MVKLTTLGDDAAPPDGSDLPQELTALVTSATDAYTKILSAQTQNELAQRGLVTLPGTSTIVSANTSNWLMWILLLGGAYLIFKDK